MSVNHSVSVRLFVTLWTVTHQAPLSMGFFVAKILQWAAMPSLQGSSQSKEQSASLMSLELAGRFFTSSATWEVPLLGGHL